MGLLQELLNPEQIGSILAPVIDNEALETGVAGVLRLLDQVDTANLSASLAVKLDHNFSLNVSGDASALTGGAFSQSQSISGIYTEGGITYEEERSASR